MIDGRSPPSWLSPFFPPFLFCSLPLLLSLLFLLRFSLWIPPGSCHPRCENEARVLFDRTAGNTRNLRTETVRAHSIAIKVRYRRSSGRPVSTLFFSVTVVARRAAFDWDSGSRRMLRCAFGGKATSERTSVITGSEFLMTSRWLFSLANRMSDTEKTSHVAEKRSVCSRRIAYGWA